MDTKHNNPSPTLTLAIWEVNYEHEQKIFWRLIEKKANRLKYLKNIDLFSLAADKAQKTQWQIKILEEELNIMAGFKVFTDQLKMAYLDTAAWLSKGAENRIEQYVQKIAQSEKNYQSLYEAYQKALENEHFYIKLANRFADKLKNLENQFCESKTEKTWA